MDNKTKRGLYLDYVNNYLTVAKFAKNNGLDRISALSLIDTEREKVRMEGVITSNYLDELSNIAQNSDSYASMLGDMNFEPQTVLELVQAIKRLPQATIEDSVHFTQGYLFAYEEIMRVLHIEDPRIAKELSNKLS